MSTIPQVEYNLEKLVQFHALAHRASSDAVRYRIVERFLCEVDRWLLKLSPSVFDVARIKESIKTLKSATMDDDSTELLEAEFQLQREFQLWRQLIEEKDRSIETYNFRRFCDSSAEPLDSEIFVALATFYKQTTYSHTNQSKFDLVVTRLFTGVDPTGRRFLSFSSTEIANRAEQLLGERDAREVANRFLDTAGAVAAIHSFIAEAHALDDFESLIESRLFDRYRDFKRELGQQFFEGSVIAAAVQCNVVFSNAFNEMLEAANDNLSEILKPEIDISAALHDPSPDAQAHLSDLLNEFFDLESPAGTPAEGSENDHIWELLSLAGGKTPTPVEKHSDISTPGLKADFNVAQSARERLTPFLETLTKSEPDAGLLLSQLSRSRSLRNLNLSDFLYAENYAPDMRSRRILGLVLWLEEFVQHELTTQSTLTPTGQQEVLTLIQKSEELATNLRSEIQAADDTAKGRLLVVLNALLEARLRLEGAIVRFTNRNLSQKRREQETPKVRVERPEPRVEHVEVERGSSGSKWLMWVMLLAVIAAAVYYFYPKTETVQPGNAIGKIEVKSLPNREYIRSAYRRENTMFVTAEESWTKLPAEKQKDVLKKLLETSEDPPIDSVVLRDSGGHLLGNASVYGIFVPQESTIDNKAN